jgi:hypothetical protein
MGRNKTDHPYPPTEWLKARIEASEIEVGESLPFKDGGLVMVTDGRIETPGTTVPIDKKWQRIKLRMVPADELWTFSSPPEYWQGLAGRMGVAFNSQWPPDWPCYHDDELTRRPCNLHTPKVEFGRGWDAATKAY